MVRVRVKVMVMVRVRLWLGLWLGLGLWLDDDEVNDLYKKNIAPLNSSYIAMTLYT